MDYHQLIDLKLLPTLLLSAAGAGLMYQLKSVPFRAWSRYLRHGTSSVSIDDKTEAFFLIDAWVAEKSKMREALHRNVEPYQLQDRASTTMAEDAAKSGYQIGQRSWRLNSGFGTYYFWHEGALFSYTKRRLKGGDSKDGGSQESREVSLRVFSRDRSRLDRMIDAAAAAVDQYVAGIKIFTWDHKYWIRQSTIDPRALESVVLPPAQKQRILDDLDQFIAGRDWYRERGVPYRRGYLFSGPPGTGKTSIVSALAGHYRRSVYLLSLSNIVNDRDLAAALCRIPSGSFVLIEDVDASGGQVKARNTDSEDSGTGQNAASRVTLGGMLNALDGLTTPQDVCFFMSSNHPEKLDPALVRPGRVDLHERLDALDAPEQETMAQRFYRRPGFVGLPFPVTPCALQQAFMFHRDDPLAAREHLLQTVPQQSFNLKKVA